MDQVLLPRPLDSVLGVEGSPLHTDSEVVGNDTHTFFSPPLIEAVRTLVRPSSRSMENPTIGTDV